jgi:hypothetical protein
LSHLSLPPLPFHLVSVPQDETYFLTLKAGPNFQNSHGTGIDIIDTNPIVSLAHISRSSQCEYVPKINEAHFSNRLLYICIENRENNPANKDLSIVVAAMAELECPKYPSATKLTRLMKMVVNPHAKLHTFLSSVVEEVGGLRYAREDGDYPVDPLEARPRKPE